ncbi:MAG: CHAT domain-containing protein [Cyanobacteria bacterium P01_A01_bin.123]
MSNSEKELLDALDNISKLNSPFKRALKLGNLASELTTPTLLLTALEIVSKIDEPEACAFALSSLSTRLDDSQILEGLRIASSIDISNSNRDSALATFRSRLSLNLDSMAEALEVARGFVSIKSYRSSSDFLAEVIPHLSPEFLKEALEIAYKIDDSQARESRFDALTELNKILRQLFNSSSEESAFRESYLPDSYPSYIDSNSSSGYRAKRNEEIDREFCEAPRARAKVLALLYYCLKEEQRSEVFEKLLEAIEEIPAQPCKAHTLIALSPHLPKNAAVRVVQRAFTIVKEIVEDIDNSLQEENAPRLREDINKILNDIQELENQLHTPSISTLSSAILDRLSWAESILFDNRWWKPNMIEGVPPAYIPKLPLAKEVTRSDQIETDSDVGGDTTPQTHVRYPNLVCPDNLVVNEREIIIVKLLLDKPNNKSEGFLIPDSGTDELPKVSVVLTAPGFHVDRHTKTLQVEQDKNSEVPFALTPLELGLHKITVRFYLDDNLAILGVIEKNVLVSEQYASEEVPQYNESAVINIETEAKTFLPATDLELFVHLSADKHKLSFGLRSEDYFGDYGEITLNFSPLKEMEARYKELDEKAKIIPDTTDQEKSSERRLAAIGRELWDKYVPQPLKEEYWEFKSSVKSILVASQEAWIPWEIIKPYRLNKKDRTREEDPFWCQQFNISRWLPVQGGGGLPGDLEITTVNPVVPNNTDLKGAKDELAFFETISTLNENIRHRVPIDTVMQVLDRLENDKELSILHFACHGAFDTGLSDEAAIKLSDASLRPSDIQIYLDKQGRRPLIFINACHVGRVGYTPTGLGGWAERMVKYRVGAFIGAMWEVTDDLALQFAETFYTGLLKDKKTIAEAFRLAREKIRQRAPHNSTWLAYSLYAAPERRLRA